MGPHGLSHPAELSKSFSRSRVRVCRWHGLGHGPNDTWQARVEHNTGGEPGGNGGGGRERGRESLHWEAQKPPPAPCCPLWGVLWVTCWGCCWRSSAPVTGCADTLLDLLTYFAHCIVGHDTVKETFLGTLFHLELPMVVSCCGVVLGQTLPLGIFKLSLSWHSHDPGLPQVFVVCSECAVAFGSRWFLNIAQLITIWKARQDPSGTLLS